jgi:hypothetical protein
VEEASIQEPHTTSQIRFLQNLLTYKNVMENSGKAPAKEI